MTNKVFSERLNHELNEMGMPERMEERIEVFSKLFKTPRFKSEAILNGEILPDNELLEKVAEELEVSVDWLLGREQEFH